MADVKKINELTESIAKLDKQIKGLAESYLSLNKDIAKSVGSVSDRVKKQNEVEKKNKEGVKELTALQKLRIKTEKDLKTTLAQKLIANEKNTKTLLKGKEAVKDQRQALVQLIKEEHANKNSIEALELANKRLVNERKKLNTETEEGRTKIRNLTNQINSNKDKLKELTTSTLKQKVSQEQQNRVSKQAAREALGLVGAYERQSRKLNELRAKYKDLILEEGRSTRETRKLERQIGKLDRRLKRVDASVGQFQRSVGNYAKGFRALGGVISAAGITLGAAGLFRVIGNGIGIIRRFGKEQAVLAGVLNTTRENTKRLNDDAIRLGSTTAKTAQEVTKLQVAYARLGFTQSEILDLTEDTINGSIALNAQLDETAALTGVVVKTFDDLSTTDAGIILDQLTFSTQRSALQFKSLQTALPIVAGAANTAGISFTRLLSLLGKLADSGIDASMSATALRNIFIESAAQGLTYEQILDKIKNSQDKLTAANDEFGKRAAVSATILSKNIDAVKELDEALQNAGGTADRVAKTQLDTLDGSIKLLTSAWEGFVLSLNNGEGNIARLVRGVLDQFAKSLNILTRLMKSNAQAFREAQDALISDNLDRYRKSVEKLTEAEIEEERQQIKNAIANKGTTERLKELSSELALLNKERQESVNQTSEQAKRFFELTEEILKEKAAIAARNKDSEDSIKIFNGQLAILDDLTKKLHEKNNINQKNTSVVNQLIDSIENENELYKIQIKTVEELKQGLAELEAQKQLINKNDIQRINTINAEIEAQKQSIDILTKASELAGEIEDATIQADKGGKTFLEILGLDTPEKRQIAIDALNQIKDTILNSIAVTTQARLQAAQQEEQRANTRISELQNELQTETALQQEGAANEVDTIKEKLDKEKELRDEAIAQQEEQSRKLLRIEQANAAISLIAAGANIAKIETSTKGAVGVPIALVAIASLLAAFTAASSNIRSQAQSFGDGGTWVEGGRRHSEGGNRYGNKELEQGERVVVFSRANTQKYDEDIVNFTNAVQNGNLEDLKWSFGNPKINQQYLFTNNNKGVESRLDSQLEQQKKTNKLLSQQLFISPDGKKITDIKGNTIIKV